MGLSRPPATTEGAFVRHKNNRKIYKIANKKLDKVLSLVKIGIGLVASEHAWLIGSYEE